MKLVHRIAVLMLLIPAISCSITNRSSYSPSTTQLNLTMEDLQYLGEAEIGITYDTYLGLFSKIRSINGADFDPTVIQRATLRNTSSDIIFFKGMNRKLNRATYLVYEKFPDADYFLVTRQVAKKTVLFLGREVESTATVKAYKIK